MFGQQTQMGQYPQTNTSPNMKCTEFTKEFNFRIVPPSPVQISTILVVLDQYFTESYEFWEWEIEWLTATGDYGNADIPYGYRTEYGSISLGALTTVTQINILAYADAQLQDQIFCITEVFGLKSESLLSNVQNIYNELFYTDGSSEEVTIEENTQSIEFVTDVVWSQLFSWESYGWELWTSQDGGVTKTDFGIEKILLLQEFVMNDVSETVLVMGTYLERNFYDDEDGTAIPYHYALEEPEFVERDASGNLIYGPSGRIIGPAIYNQGLEFSTGGIVVSSLGLYVTIDESGECTDWCVFHFSNFQLFGFTYFTPVITQPENTQIFVPTGMGTVAIQTIEIAYTYLIGGDSVIVNDQFAISGIYIDLVYTSYDDPTILLFVQNDALSFQLSVDSSWVTQVGNDITFTIQAKDVRNPSFVATQDITLKYRAACNYDDINVLVQFNDSEVEYYLTQGEGFLSYSIEESSDCIGYFRTEMDIEITMEDGMDYTPDCCGATHCCEVQTQYTTCQALGNSNCFWNDLASGVFYFQFDDPTFLGVNTFTFSNYAYYYTGLSDTANDLKSITSQSLQVTALNPCISGFEDPASIRTLKQYQDFAAVSNAETQWYSAIPLALSTDYLARYSATPGTVQLEAVVDFKDLSYSSGNDPYQLCQTKTYELTQVTTSTQAQNFYSAGLLSLVGDELGDSATITVSAVTDKTYVGITDVQFKLSIYYTAIHSWALADEVSQSLLLSLSVNKCVPETSSFYIVTTSVIDGMSTTTRTDLLNYTYIYNRSNSNEVITIEMTLDPNCDDADGIVTLAYSLYTLTVVQTTGSLTFTINLTQPPYTDSDSTQTVTLTYTHGTHINSVPFTVKYDACGISYFIDQDVGPYTAYINDVQPSTNFNFTQFQDFQSQKNGNKDGVTHCGARTYTIDPLLYPFVTTQSTVYPTGTVTQLVVQASSQYLGGYDVSMIVSLANYPQVQWTVQVTINIEVPIDLSTVCTITYGWFSQQIGFTYMLGTGPKTLDTRTLFAFTGPCEPEYIFWYQWDGDESLEDTGVTWDNFPEVQFELESDQLDPMPTYAVIDFYFWFYDSVEYEYMDCYIEFSVEIVAFTEPEEEDIIESEEDEEADEEEDYADESSFFLIEDWPEEPEIILCLGTSSSKNWEYQFPDLVDEDADVSFINFALGKMMKFDSKSNSLSIDQSAKPKESGIYQGIFTVSTDELTETYSVEFEYDCEVELSEEELTPPIPVVDKATADGKIVIKWDKPMKLPKETVIDSGGNLQVLSLQDKRTLAAKDHTISMKMIQGSDAEQIDPALIGSLTWVLQWLNELETEIVVSFENPQYVSAISGQKDTLEVTIDDPSLFVSSSDIQADNGITFTIALPKMFGKNEVKLELGGVAAASSASLGLAFVLSFILKAVLNQLLGLVDSISLITHMFLLSLMYPVNVQEFFAQIFPLIAFDLLPFDAINENLFAFEEVEDDEPVTEQFEAVGYESRLIVLTLGDIYYMIFLSPGVVAILFGIKFSIRYFCCMSIRPFKWFRNYIDFQISGYFWNGSIQFIVSGYLIISMCIFIGLYNIKIGEDFLWQENLCSYTSIFLATTVFPFPIVIGLILYRNIKNVPLPDLEDSMSLKFLRDTYGTIDIDWINKHAYTKAKHTALKEKYGVMIQGHALRRNGKTITIVLAVVPLLRKFITAWAITMFTETPQFAIMTFTMTTQFQIMLDVYFRPLKDRRTHRINLFNEITVMFIIYHLFLLTDFTDLTVKGDIGNSVIYITCFNIVVNFFLILIPELRTLGLKCKKAHKVRAMKRRQKNLQKDKVKPELTIEQSADGPKTIVGQTVTEMVEDELWFQNNRRKKIIENGLVSPPAEQAQSVPPSELIVEDFNTSVEMAEVNNQIERAPKQVAKQGPLINQKQVVRVSRALQINRTTQLLDASDNQSGMTNHQIGMQQLRRKNLIRRSLSKQKSINLNSMASQNLNSVEEAKAEEEISVKQSSVADRNPMDDSLLFAESMGGSVQLNSSKEVKFNQTFGKKQP